MFNKPWLDKYDIELETLPGYSGELLKDQFLKQVEKHGSRPFLYCDDQILTYSQINERATGLANFFLSFGLKPGDRLAISLPNSPEFVITALACFKIGVVAVLTNPRYTEYELESQYSDSGAKLVVCRENELQKTRNIIHRKTTDLRSILVVRKDEVVCSSGDDTRDFNASIENMSDQEPEYSGSVQDIVIIIYTGGTTGSSKGCCIDTVNLNAVSFGWIHMCRYFTDVDRYKVLSTTPMYHVHGFQTAINANIVLGGSVIIPDDISSDEIIAAINRHEPNVWPSVPRQIISLSSHPDLRCSKASRIQHIGCGSSPIPTVVMERFEEIVGVPIMEGYGATETSMAVSCNPMKKRKLGSVGIPYPAVDCKVVDLETGDHELPFGQMGELCFKGPQIIKKYWKKPEETAYAFRRGWWYSGDIGYMDEDGFLYIVDRKKDMIICSGFKVFCSEVENALSAHPAVREAAIIGVPDPVKTETVRAFIVTKDGESLNSRMLDRHCRRYLAAYKVPSSYEFIDKLPRTSILKVDKKALRKKISIPAERTVRNNLDGDFPFLFMRSTFPRPFASK